MVVTLNKHNWSNCFLTTDYQRACTVAIYCQDINTTTQTANRNWFQQTTAASVDISPAHTTQPCKVSGTCQLLVYMIHSVASLSFYEYQNLQCPDKDCRILRCTW